MLEANPREKAAFLEKIYPSVSSPTLDKTLTGQRNLLLEKYERTHRSLRKISELTKKTFFKIYQYALDFTHWISQKGRWKWSTLFAIIGVQMLFPDSFVNKLLQSLILPFSLATVSTTVHSPIPTRKFRLAQIVTVIENAKKSKEDISEEEYRNLNLAEFISLPENQYPRENERRLETYLKHQAASPAQAILELIANGQDASVLDKKIGRFGVGGYQVLGELENKEDRVILESSKDGMNGTRFIFWLENGEVMFDYEVLAGGSISKGTRLQVLKRFNKEEVKVRRKFIERKLRVNTRGPIQRVNGSRINHPEDYLYLNAKESGVVDSMVPPVTVNVSVNGYEVKDSGNGMGLKEILERFLIPKRTDKPLMGGEETRCFYKPDSSTESDSSLWLTGVEIESHTIRGKANLVKEAIFELPHDTDISEERGVLNLVPSNQNVTVAIEGMKRMIDKLVDPNRKIENRFALINTLVALLEIKQPKKEKGLLQGNLEEATDLVWYLKEKLNAQGGLIETYRVNGTLFLPNNIEWSRFQSWQDRITLLDPSLLEKNEDLPKLIESLEDVSNHPIFEPIRQRNAKILLVEFEESAGEEDPIIVQSQDSAHSTVIIDKSVFEKYQSEPEILVARLKKSLPIKNVPLEKKEPKKRTSWLNRLHLRILIPLFFIFGTVLSSTLSDTVSRPDITKHSSPSPTAYSIHMKSKPSYETDYNSIRSIPSFPSLKNKFEIPQFDISSQLNWLITWINNIIIIPLSPDQGQPTNQPYLEDLTINDTDLFPDVQNPISITSPAKGYGLLGRSKMLKYGTIIENLSGPLITGIYPHLLDNGRWSAAGDLEFSQKKTKKSSTVTIGVALQVKAANTHSTITQKGYNYTGPVFRFEPYQILNGDIENLQIENLSNDIPVKFFFDKKYNQVIITENYKGQLYIQWKLNQYSNLRDLKYKILPLPENELRDFPKEWRLHLDDAKHYSDGFKLYMIYILMKNHLIYDAKAYFAYNGKSWGSSAQELLSQGKKIPIICNTSSLYFYLMARYVGLPAAYVTIENTDNNGLYFDLAKHAGVLVRANKKWEYVETTTFTELKNPAPKWIPLQQGSNRHKGGILGLDKVLPISLGLILLYSLYKTYKEIIKPIFQKLRMKHNIQNYLKSFDLPSVFDKKFLDSFNFWFPVQKNIFRYFFPWGDISVRERAVYVEEYSGEHKVISYIDRNEWIKILYLIGKDNHGLYLYGTTSSLNPIVRFLFYSIFAPFVYLPFFMSNDWSKYFRKPKIWFLGKGGFKEIHLPTSFGPTFMDWSNHKRTILLDKSCQKFATIDHSTHEIFLFNFPKNMKVWNISKVGESKNNKLIYYIIYDEKGYRLISTAKGEYSCELVTDRIYDTKERAEQDIDQMNLNIEWEEISSYSTYKKIKESDFFEFIKGGEHLKFIQNKVLANRDYWKQLDEKARNTLLYFALTLLNGLAYPFCIERSNIGGLFGNDRIDEFIKKNLHRQEELREILKLAGNIENYKRALALERYMEIAEKLPDLEVILREHLLRKYHFQELSMTEIGVGFLSSYREKNRKELPPLTQFFLTILLEGFEGLLKEEEEAGPSQPVKEILETHGESLAKLLLATHHISAQAIKEGGLSRVEQAYQKMDPEEPLDLSDIRGAVNNQETVLPVWIRELIQNSRDAIRHAIGRNPDGKNGINRSIQIRSYTHQGRWIVSVKDKIGIPLENILQKLLTPDATTKSAKDGILQSGFFGQGFFTVFADADQVLVRTGIDGRLHEALLTSVKDPQTNQIVDIQVNWMKSYEDPTSEFKGTEIQRIKYMSPENLHKIQTENAYLRFQVTKYCGSIFGYNISWNGTPIQDSPEKIGEEKGVQSKLSGDKIARVTVDELYIEELNSPFLKLVPHFIQEPFLKLGWNLDFPAGTSLVRTRNRIQNPDLYHARIAVLALKSAGALYKNGSLVLEGIQNYENYFNASLGEIEPIPEWIYKDAEFILSGRYEQGDDAKEFWERFENEYLNHPASWAKLMVLVSPSLLELKDKLDQLKLEEEKTRSQMLEASSHFKEEVGTKAMFHLMGLVTSMLSLSPEQKMTVDLKKGLFEAFQIFLQKNRIEPFAEKVMELTHHHGSPEKVIQFYDAWLRSGLTKKEILENLAELFEMPLVEESLTQLKEKVEKASTAILSIEQPSRLLSILDPLIQKFWKKGTKAYYHYTTKGAPAWEEALFRLLPLSLSHTTLSSLSTLEPLGIGMVLGVSIGLFAFAHTIVRWVVRAHDQGYKKGYLPWDYATKNDLPQLLQVLIPSTFFTLVYLISFQFMPFSSSIFSHLLSYAIVVFVHGADNTAILKNWIPEWMTLGLISNKEESIEDEIDSVVKQDLTRFPYASYYINKSALNQKSQTQQVPLYLIDLQGIVLNEGEEGFDLLQEDQEWVKGLVTLLQVHAPTKDEPAPKIGFVLHSNNKEKTLQTLKERWGIEEGSVLFTVSTPEEAIDQAKENNAKVISLLTERPQVWGAKFAKWIVTLGSGKELKIQGQELKMLKKLIHGKLGEDGEKLSIKNGELVIPKKTLGLDQTEESIQQTIHFNYQA